MKNKIDKMLIGWFICELITNLTLLFGSIYLVLWRGCSGWWIVLALILCDYDSVKALKKQYGIIEKEKE